MFVNTRSPLLHPHYRCVVSCLFASLCWAIIVFLGGRNWCSGRKNSTFIFEAWTHASVTTSILPPREINCVQTLDWSRSPRVALIVAYSSREIALINAIRVSPQSLHVIVVVPGLFSNSFHEWMLQASNIRYRQTRDTLKARTGSRESILEQSHDIFTYEIKLNKHLRYSFYIKL